MLVRLFQREEVLVPPVAGELVGNLRFGLLAPWIPHLRKLSWITLPVDDRLEYPHPGGSVDVGHRMVYPNVHLVAALLDPLDRLRAGRDDVFALTDYRPYGIVLLWRSEAAAKESAAVQPL